MARKVTTYTCQNPKCRAEDHDRGNNDPSPSDPNCFNCHGRASMIPTSIETVE